MSNFNNQLFSTRLRALRKSKSLTLEEFGKYFNVTKQSTSRWESGDRLPPLNIVQDIADFFDVSVDYLLGRTDNPKINK